VAGIVLAAGRSTRMGQTKQRIALGDKTLLQHVIANALAAGLDPVIVVLGHEADAIRVDIEASDDASRLHVVVNAAYADGQSSSLRAGLAALGPEPDAAAVLLADQPGVGPTLIRRVVAEYRAAGAAMTRPLHRARVGRADEDEGDAKVPGHPVVLSREIWPDLALLRGDEGARALARRHPEWLRFVPVDGQAPADVDTPADLERIRS
jgi:molybdenum cofactor cytidylyltransferase